MSVQTQSLTQESYAAALSSLCHLVCDCDVNTAACGLDVTHEWWDLDCKEMDCALCHDAWPDDAPCPHCGEYL